MADATPIVDSEEVIARDQRYLVRNYGRYPLVVRRARGVYLHCAEGRRYLDFISATRICASSPRSRSSSAR